MVALTVVLVAVVSSGSMVRGGAVGGSVVPYFVTVTLVVVLVGCGRVKQCIDVDLNEKKVQDKMLAIYVAPGFRCDSRYTFKFMNRF